MQVRDLLPAHPHLRVVLMSATLHVDLFSGEDCYRRAPQKMVMKESHARGARE